MKKIQLVGKALLWAHLFVCAVWIYAFHATEPHNWVGHVIAWSILGIQFTWGFTVGLIVGPGRARRPLLWFSLLTVVMPLWLLGILVWYIAWAEGLIIALVYLAVFAVMLASETYCGVMLGAKTHAGWERGNRS